MAQQTAIDWIVDQMLSEGHKEMWKDMIQQAKQMEKEQLENARPQITSSCVIKEISDEEIEKEAKQTFREHPNNPKEHTDWTYGKDVNFARKQKAFIKGAKWYREQLKKKI